MPMKRTPMLLMLRLGSLAVVLLATQLAFGQDDKACLSCHPSPGLLSRLAKGETTRA